MALKSREPDTRLVRPAPVVDAMTPKNDNLLQRKGRTRREELVVQERDLRCCSTVKKNEAQKADRCHPLNGDGSCWGLQVGRPIAACSDAGSCLKPDGCQLRETVLHVAR